MNLKDLIPGRYYRFTGYADGRHSPNVGAIIHFKGLETIDSCKYHPGRPFSFLGWRYEELDQYEDSSEEELLIAKLSEECT
jgi:hypothetical protein